MGATPDNLDRYRGRRLSPEEAHEALAIVGTKKGVARELGVHISTFRNWLDPQALRDRVQRLYWENPEPKRAKARQQYEDFTEFEMNRRRLHQRRLKALQRIEERRQRKEATSGSL